MLDLDTGLRFVAAFALVIGLIALMSYVAKRWRGVGPIGGRKGRRLEVVEAVGIDAKRRVVILRVDDAEHVLLVGGESDLALEKRPAADRAAPALDTETTDAA